MRGSGDLLGALLQAGMRGGVGQRRLDRSLQQGGGLDGLLGSLLGGQGGGAPTRHGGAQAGDVLGGFLGQARDALQRNPSLASGGIGALAGALLGGRGTMGGAVGGAALGVLGMIAVNALREAPGRAAPAAAPAMPQTVDDEATLVLTAMVEAAKADGEIDETELETIIGRLTEAGIDEEGKRWLMDEIRRPAEPERLLAAAYDPRLAAEVYAAALLAIEVDTPAERRWLAQLAQGLGLDPTTVRSLHRQLEAPDAAMPAAPVEPPRPAPSLKSPWRAS
jgi:uncharacterized membrane protein YebE (DUF533 family)